MSRSSGNLIQKRTRDFFKIYDDWHPSEEIFKDFNLFLNKEYSIIPKRERIGKGVKFIANHVAKGIFELLVTMKYSNKKYIIKFIEFGFIYGESHESLILQHFCLHILAEFIYFNPDDFDDMVPLIEKYARYMDWSIRETTADSIISGLKRIPEKTLKLLSNWALSDDEYLRRIVSESLRPHSALKWLRNPSKNDQILEILSILRKDPSIYVRKSVGNNLKDLTKYMPEKILKLAEIWINDAEIKVHAELAMETGLSKEEKRLIWTLKHALRWVKNRIPELHHQVEKILGKNYLLYFDEKRNRLAKPLEKN
jgi:3-methyladenine DNA glycosylase AlkC